MPKVPRLAFTALGLLALAIAAWRRLRRRRKRGHEATALLSRIERILVRAHLSPGEGEDLEGFSKRLASERHPLHHPLSQATERYLDARFGHRPLRPGEAQHILTKLKRALAAQRAYVNRH
jgi:hypothetical protein